MDKRVLEDGKVLYRTSSEDETAALGSAFASYARSFSATGQGPLTVSLTGEMGCGKTAFVKGMMKGLGYSGLVTSPTFSLCNRYETGLIVYHLDLYRVTGGADELFSAGLLDLEDADAVMVEWADLDDGAIDFTLRISFAYGEKENERQLVFSEDVLHDIR